jgi:hypothetical protein
MKATDLSVFYQLGANLSYFLDHVNIGDPAGELYTGLQIRLRWLVAFRSETFELADTLKETCEVVEHIITALHGLMDSIPKDWDRPVVQGEVQGLHYWKGLLDEAFQREQRNLDVFAVTPKGLYNTRYLIEHPEKQPPSRHAGGYTKCRHIARLSMSCIPCECAHPARSTSGFARAMNSL